ncbi:hypothetical protein Tco_0387592, partial [Tanacetum coccineum]
FVDVVNDLKTQGVIDRPTHAHTARLIEAEARTSRKAWVQSMDASDTTRSDVRSLRTTTQIAALQSQQTPARDLAHCWEIYCKRFNTSSITVKSGSIS